MPSSAFRITPLIAALVVVAALLVVSLAFLLSKPSTQIPVAVAPATSRDSVPAAGPDSKWQTVRQNALDDTSGRILAGTRATRETLTQEQGAHTQLMLTEFEILYAGQLELFLRSPAVQTTSIADRSGYLIPMAGLTSSTAFLLVGSSTALLIEYGDDRYGNLMPWPETLEAEVVTFIKNARVD